VHVAIKFLVQFLPVPLAQSHFLWHPNVSGFKPNEFPLTSTCNGSCRVAPTSQAPFLGVGGFERQGAPTALLRASAAELVACGLLRSGVSSLALGRLI